MPKFFLKLILTIILLIIIFQKIEGASFLAALSRISWAHFYGVGLFFLLLLILPALSQKILFQAVGFPLSLASIYEINLASMFYSLIVPGDVAAGLARLIKFSKAHRASAATNENQKKTILVVMATDRFLNMASLMLPLPFLLWVAPLPNKTEWFFKTSFVLSFIFVLFFITGKKLPAHRFPKKPFFTQLGTLLAIFQTMKLHKLFFSLGGTLLYQILSIVFIDIWLAKSLGLSLPWLEFASIAATIRFARFIPVTLSGIGIREGLFPFFLHFFGVDFETALTLGLLGTMLSLLGSFLGGIIEAHAFYFKTSSRTAHK